MSVSVDQRTQGTSSRLDKSTQCSEFDLLIYQSSSNSRYSTFDTKKGTVTNGGPRKRTEEAWRNVTFEDERRKSNEGEEALKKAGKFLLKTAVISGAVLGGVAVIVPALGFGALGVTGGSLAAAYQSAALGGTIASGSAFATLQSIGAAGLAASTKFGIVAGSGVLAAATSGSKKKSEKDKQQDSKNSKQNNSKTTVKKYERPFCKDIGNDVGIERNGYKHASTQIMTIAQF